VEMDVDVDGGGGEGDGKRHVSGAKMFPMRQRTLNRKRTQSDDCRRRWRRAGAKHACTGAVRRSKMSREPSCESFRLSSPACLRAARSAVNSGSALAALARAHEV